MEIPRWEKSLFRNLSNLKGGVGDAMSAVLGRPLGDVGDAPFEIRRFL